MDLKDLKSFIKKQKKSPRSALPVPAVVVETAADLPAPVECPKADSPVVDPGRPSTGFNAFVRRLDAMRAWVLDYMPGIAEVCDTDPGRELVYTFVIKKLNLCEELNADRAPFFQNEKDVLEYIKNTNSFEGLNAIREKVAHFLSRISK